MSLLTPILTQFQELDLHLDVVKDHEIQELRLLVNAAYQELSDMGLNYTATYQDEALTRERIRQGKAFVLKRNQKIIATILLSTKNHFTHLRTAYISQFAVTPHLKRHGIGRLLMDYCEAVAKTEKFEGVQLDTAQPAQHLVRWYQQLGYIIVGETAWDGKTYKSWIFEKRF